MKFIDGGVCAAKGFKASGIHCGVKTSNLDKKDVALIVADKECNASAVYTKNIVKAAPLIVTKEHLENGKARAVICNSGNANACAPEGEENAIRMCKAIAAALNISESDIAVASTGVIGQRLRVEVIEEGVPKLVELLSENGSDDAAQAIMTTDLVKKECAVEFDVSGVTAKLGGIAKGSGMIHPNMGTMLCFITTDCAVSAQMLSKALKKVTNISFNRISVDGDTSTNDMCVVLASGDAGNSEISDDGADFDKFCRALEAVCVTLARDMASDGEGAKHLITCTVSGASSEEKAEIIAKSVISSTLVKAAVFGADANCGRILCAMGYSGADFDTGRVDVSYRSAAGIIAVVKDGCGLPFDEAIAKNILSEHDVDMLIKMDEGDNEVTCWGCDITYDYIKINGDYRT